MQQNAFTRTTQASDPQQPCAVVGCRRVELLPSRPYEAAYTPDAPVIGFAFESQTGVHAFASDRRTDFRARPNSLAYVPTGCEVVSHSPQGGEYLTLKVAERPVKRRPPQCRFNDVVDATAIDAAQRLRCMLLAADPVDPLLLERSALALEERVNCVLSGTHVVPRASGWMTVRRLRIVDEIIESKLESKLTVEELAAALGLSAGFFTRAFKAAVGKAPHDYVIDRRISRARALLNATRLRLSAVAMASGFASHAHMTALFRSRLGVTPSEFRRNFS